MTLCSGKVGARGAAVGKIELRCVRLLVRDDTADRSNLDQGEPGTKRLFRVM
jgi:hypothetical protein